MTHLPEKASQGDQKFSRAIQCTHCHKTFVVSLADRGKDIHFLNMITWDCPKCKQKNITPFLEHLAS